MSAVYDGIFVGSPRFGNRIQKQHLCGQNWQLKGIELAADLNYMTTLVLDDAEQVRAQQLTELCRASNYTECPK